MASSSTQVFSLSESLSYLWDNPTRCNRTAPGVCCRERHLAGATAGAVQAIHPQSQFCSLARHRRLSHVLQHTHIPSARPCTLSSPHSRPPPDSSVAQWPEHLGSSTARRQDGRRISGQRAAADKARAGEPGRAAAAAGSAACRSGASRLLWGTLLLLLQNAHCKVPYPDLNPRHTAAT